MLRRTQGLFMILALAGLCICWTAPAQGPDDRRVETYKNRKQELIDKYTRKAETKEDYLEEEKTLVRLNKPVKLGQNVKIRWWARGKWQTITGRLYSVSATRARVGGRTVIKRDVDPVDWVRLQMAGKPKELQNYIAQRKKELAQNRAKFIETNVEGDLERTYKYTKEFWANSIEFAGRYWLREELGDNTMDVFISVPYDIDYHDEFVEFTMTYRGGLPLSALLEYRTIPPDVRRKRRKAELSEAAEDDADTDAEAAEKDSDTAAEEADEEVAPEAKPEWITLAAVYEPDPRERIRDANWQTRKFRVLLKDIADSPQSLFKNFPRNSRIVVLKKDVGRWQLKPASSRQRGIQNSRVPCPECWGKKFSEPDPEVKTELDVSDDPLIKGILENGGIEAEEPGKNVPPGKATADGDEWPAAGDTGAALPPPDEDYSDLAAGPDEFQPGTDTAPPADAAPTEPEEKLPPLEKRADGKMACRRCRGSGTVTKRHNVALLKVNYKLDEKTIQSFDMDRVKQFELMAKKPDFAAAAKAREKEIGDQTREERIAELKGEAEVEIKQRLEALQRLRGRKLQELVDVRFDWYTLTEMANPPRDDTGARIGIKDWVPAKDMKIDDADAPNKVLGLRVERYSPWFFIEGLLDRRRGLFEILKVHYRILQCKPSEEGLQPAFVIQYAILFYGGNSSLLFTPVLTLPVKEASTFPLAADEEQIVIKQSFNTKARWLGTLIGAKEISLSQAMGKIQADKVKLQCIPKKQ